MLMQPEQSEENQFNYQQQGPVAAQENTEKPAEIQTPTTAKRPSDETITWQASEFIDNEKPVGWFMLLGIGTVLVCGLMFLLTRSIFSSAIIALAALTFGIVAKQKPRNLNYALLPNALQVGDKNYSYDDFKTFSVAEEGAMPSIVLKPIKRFMPDLTIYFPLEEGEKIFDVLATHIPHEEHQPDSVDRLMRKIRY